MKHCKGCDETKPLNEFGPNKAKKDGKQGYCKPCQRLSNRNSRARNSHKPCTRCNKNPRAGKDAICKTCRDHYKYGLTKEQSEHFRSIKACQVCGKTKETSGKRLALDHCHTTGKARGILCRNCNVALGFLNDDPVLIRSLEMYVNNAHYRNEQATVSSN